MDTVFSKPALRTYSRAGRNRHPRWNDMNEFVFTEKALKTLERSAEVPQDDTRMEDPNENQAEQPSTGKMQKREEKGSPTNTKRSRVALEPQTQRGKLKKGRQATRKPSVIGHPRSRKPSVIGHSKSKKPSVIGQPRRRCVVQKKLKSLPKETIPANDKVKDWLEKSRQYCRDQSDEYPSKEIMRGEEQVSDSVNPGHTDSVANSADPNQTAPPGV